MKNLLINKISKNKYNKILDTAPKNKTGPFSHFEVMESIQNSLITQNGIESKILSYSINDQINKEIAIGLLFNIKIGEHRILLSGGRFGYSQIQNISNKVEEIDIQKCFDNFSLDNDISLCSLAFDYNFTDRDIKSSKWKIKKKNYLISNIADSCLNGKLSFPTALKRSSLSRGIKLAKKK